MKRVFLIYWFLLTIFTSKSFAQIDHPDYPVLEAIYYATYGEIWYNNTYWLSNEPLSTWYGIKVDENNRVSEINLENNGLEGFIPDELGQLVTLRALNLGHNYIYGSIPSSISSLSNLEELRVNYTDILSDFPEFIGQLSNLKILDLSGNYFLTGLPNVITSLNNLNELYLSNSNLYGSVPNLIGLNLQSLFIDRNHFQFGDFENEFSTYNANIPNFKYNNQIGEYLWDNYTSIGGDLVLETTVSGASNTYSWYKYNLDSGLWVLIPNESNPSLTINDFQVSDVGNYQCVVKSNIVTNLEIIWKFPVSAPASASPDYEALLTIYNATDGSNWFDNTNWTNPDVPLETWYGVKVVENLRVIELSLWENNLSGTIPPDIGRLEYLTRITLAENPELTGPIPEEFWDLKNLVNILLWKNSLTGELSPKISNLKSLKNLNLGENNFSGKLPIELGELENLENLRLFENSFEGTIPKELGELENLIELSLFNNNFIGELPQELFNLTQLKYLSLDGNDLIGNIPSEIDKLVNLDVLGLGYNHFDGEIPREIGNMSSLTSLILSRNQFSGVIPEELGNLNLYALGLDNNNLSGPIPKGIFEMSNLFLLWLHSNKLSGSIPNTIGNLNLSFLRLNSNELSGSIPKEIGNLTKLRELYLHYNNFSGELPAEIGQLSNLRTLELWSNNLSGSLPEELGNLYSIRELGVGANNFSGSLPSTIANLSNLTRLDIEVNNLSGQIPDLTNLPLQVLFIGSNNFIFSDFESQFQHWENNIPELYYTPMNNFNQYEEINKISPPKENIILTTVFADESNSSSNNNYQWYKDYFPIAGATKPVYEIKLTKSEDSGFYTCTVSNDIISELVLERNPYYINILDKNPNPKDTEFRMYPNPAKDIFKVISNEISEGFLQVYDFNAILVFEGYYSSDFSNSFDVSYLKNGVYIVKLSAFEEQVYYGKLIKI